jgi:hypothetical protein
MPNNLGGLSGSTPVTIDVLRQLIENGIIAPGLPHMSQSALTAAGYVTTGGGTDVNYCGNIGSGQSTIARAIDTLWSTPLMIGRTGAISRMACVVTATAANATVRLGLYDSDPANAFYPTNLLFQSGSIDAASSTGLKTATVTGVNVRVGQVVWLTYQSGTTAPTTVSSVNLTAGSNCAIPILGSFTDGATSVAAYNGITKSGFPFANGMPATYPAAAGLVTNSGVLVTITYA